MEQLKEASIYEFPAVFRVVHMEARSEIAQETAFLKRVWKRHLAAPVKGVLDVASGNSPHGQILAREGLQVIGIDRSPTMLEAGRREARGLAGLRFFRRDIERFRLPLRRRLDVAFFMSETFTVMVDNAALLGHLRAVAQVLRRGGLYCVDIDRHDGLAHVTRRQLWRKRQVRRGRGAGRIEVEVREYRHPIEWFAGTWIYELECRIRKPGPPQTTRDLIAVRYTVPKLLELAALASGCFVLEAVYTDLSFTTPLAKCDRRWLGVLRRV